MRVPRYAGGGRRGLPLVEAAIARKEGQKLASESIERAGLQVDAGLVAFIEGEALPGTGVELSQFWDGFARLLADFAPRNAQLLAKRDRIQAEIDQFYRANAGKPFDLAAQKALLVKIGYLVPVPDEVAIGTQNVDDELARIAGPQLVVPASNARYALNAANARWGSLYDALYGTDALGSLPPPA